MPNEFPVLSIQQLLSNNQYVIPRYQRNFAWTEEHIKQLIDDVLDNVNKNNKKEQPYYLGTLVVFPRSIDKNLIYEVIDGQQRLTTLTLLASYLTYPERINQNDNKHWYSTINLEFESRKKSSETLIAAHNGNFHDSSQRSAIKSNHTEEIVNAYGIIQRIFKEKGLNEKQFNQYFLSQVKICRVGVPADTDLNHYFEIMNNRGEQLEKHEVLKARLLDKLSPGNDQYVFNRIWEACSAMDKYIQYGFQKKLREQLFSITWDRFVPKSTEDLYNTITENIRRSEAETDEKTKFKLDKLITQYSLNQKSINEEDDNEEDAERFSSIINFQNFLPHVLSIFLNDGKSIPLDDKQLLDSFSILESCHSEKIKRFSFDLLKTRFLFDQNIIKRDANEDEREWSLKELHQTDQGNPSYRNSFSNSDEDQKVITLLQSMFHVSVPSRPYKYWLQGTLRYLINQDDLSAHGFQNHLKNQAKAFVYNRFLASSSLDYNQIIFKNEGKPVPTILNLSKTQYGQIENILIFNFIDFLLWEKLKENDERIKDFEYSFRSSVEHYYPQNPNNGETLSNKEILHSIGNLCLISHGKNSMLRHNLPKAKAEDYLKQPHIDSVLQHVMLKKASEWSDFPESAIKEQETMILKLIEENKP